MNNFKTLNNITGWVVLIIATTVYTLTVEPTASFWDCGEFIACAYKMQVPHPPGSPMFLLIGKMFSFLAFGELTKIAFWVNMVSVMSSAFTIMFLYWTIVLIAKKILIEKDEEPTQGQQFTLMFSGIIGALAYTFSDTFWFSAAEAEVYALSSFFTAIVFWAMLKWETIDDESLQNKWLIFIAYLMGLSIGVHLLNLVALPALALIYYYKKFKNHTPVGTIAALVAGVFCVGIIQVGIIPGLPTVAGKFEITFVNSFGMPVYSGILIFAVLLFGAIGYLLYYSIKKNKIYLNTGIIALLFILIGYSSYMIIPIRSTFNPPLDENDPQEVMSFVSYVKREQYGERVLLYGPTIKANAVQNKKDKDKPKYRIVGDKYEVYDYGYTTVYDDELKKGKDYKKHHMLFPRIHSTQQNHKTLYNKWVDIPGGDRKISMGTNLKYFFTYQINHMFTRYFMWNFAGRAHDFQDADWLSPFASNKDLPFLMSNSKARNQFYMLPFLLGLAGVIFGLMRNGKVSMVLGVLFFFTGIGIIIFLNQPPVEPRERDYTYAGAFYTFAIWIGLGVTGISFWLKDFIKNDMLRPILAFGVSLIVPVIMAAEGWDDHDRSKRYFSVDSAKNLLQSCDKNAIIFTGGDNDTFPLWYVQEVEEFRTDVRVCNLSLLNTDWYINLMKQDAYKSKALPITMKYDEYIQGTNDYVPYYEQTKKPIPISTFIKMIRTGDKRIQQTAGDGRKINTFPTQNFTFPVNKDSLFKYEKNIPENLKGKVLDRITWNVNKGRGLEKKHLIMLDMLQQNAFKRPIYFSTTISSSDYLNLQDYFQLEGLAYKFLPIKNANRDGRIHTDVMYDKMMTKFSWRNLDDPSVFYDENYRRFPANTREKFHRLAMEFYNKGEKEKALEVVNHCLKVMPDESVPFDQTVPNYIDILFKLDQEERALKIAEKMLNRYITSLDYYAENDFDFQFMFIEQDVSAMMYNMYRIMGMITDKNKDLFKKVEAKFEYYYKNQNIRRNASRFVSQLDKMREQQRMREQQMKQFQQMQQQQVPAQAPQQ